MLKIVKNNNYLFKAFSYVLLFTIFSRIIGLLKDIVIAAYFGTTESADFISVSYVFILWLPAIAASILNTYTIPRLIEHDSNNERNFKRYLSLLNSIMLRVVIISLTTFFIFGPEIFYKFFPSFSDAQINNLTFKIRILSLGLAFLMISFFWESRLQAFKKNLFILFECIPSITIIFSIIFSISPSVNNFIFGLILGLFLQSLSLFVYSKRNKLVGNINKIKNLTYFKPELGLFVFILSQLLISLVPIVDSYFVIKFGIGEIASLNYSNKITAIFMTIAGTVLTRVLLPHYSALVLKNRLKKIVFQHFIKVFLLGVFINIFIFFNSSDLISLIYSRGVFGDNDVSMVNKYLKISIFQIPIYISGLVLLQYIAARKFVLIIAISTILSLILKFSFIPLLLNNFQELAVIYSTIIMYTFNTFVFLIVTILSKEKKYEQSSKS